MSIVAFKSGVLAADSLCVDDDGFHGGRANKIGRAGDGALWGFVGEAWKAEAFRKWAEGDRESDPPAHDHKESIGIIVTPDWRVRSWYGDGWFEHDAPFMAWGAGAGPALGAMAHGADAETAVGIAIMLCPGNCGPPIEVLRLDELGGELQGGAEEPEAVYEPPAPLDAAPAGLAAAAMKHLNV